VTTLRNSFSGSSRLKIGPTYGYGSLSLLTPPYDNVTLFSPKVKVPGAEEADRAPANSCGAAISRSGVASSPNFAAGHESVARSFGSMSAAFNPASPQAGARSQETREPMGSPSVSRRAHFRSLRQIPPWRTRATSEPRTLKSMTALRAVAFDPAGWLG